MARSRLTRTTDIALVSDRGRRVRRIVRITGAGCGNRNQSRKRSSHEQRRASRVGARVRRILGKLPEGGLAVIGSDNQLAQSLTAHDFRARIVTYGFDARGGSACRQRFLCDARLTLRRALETLRWEAWSSAFRVR